MHLIEWFSNNGQKTNTKVITPTNQNRTENSAMNQLELPAITSNLLKAREIHAYQVRFSGATLFPGPLLWLKGRGTGNKIERGGDGYIDE